MGIIVSKALSTWPDLNTALREATEDDCKLLLEIEKAGHNRPTFLFRIHSRLNKVRADRERAELGGREHGEA